MKSDPDVTLTGQDATFLIAKVRERKRQRERERQRERQRETETERERNGGYSVSRLRSQIFLYCATDD